MPGGLLEFLAPLQQAGLCVMTPQPTSSGYWTIYMDTLPPLTPVPRSPSQASQMTVNGGPDLYEGAQNGFRNGGGPPLNGNGGPHHPEEPEIQTIRLSKTNGMGLSIVAAKGQGKERLGIYIKGRV